MNRVSIEEKQQSGDFCQNQVPMQLDTLQRRLHVRKTRGMLNDLDISCESAENNRTNEDQKQDNSSLAYQYGMMFVKGAAKMVSNAAGSSKRNEISIEQLQNDLEITRKKYDAVECELLNVKEWISHYKNENKQLESQLNESDQSYRSRINLLNEKLKNRMQKLQELDKQTQHANLLRKAVQLDLDKAKKTIEVLESQVKEQKDLLMKYTMKKTESSTQASSSSDEKAVQAEFPDPSNEELSENLRLKKQELEEMIKELNIAISASDSLRQQLQTSINYVRSNLFEMKSCRIVLESALNDAKEAKLMVAKESDKSLMLQNQLKEEKEARLSVVKELENNKKELLQIRADKEEMQTHFEHSVAEHDGQHQTIIFNMHLKSLAQDIVSNAIAAAVQSHQQYLHKSEVKLLQKNYNKSLKKFKSMKHERNCLEHKISVVQSQLNSKTSCLEQCKEQINYLTLKIAQYQKEFESKITSENNLKDTIANLQVRLSELNDQHSHKCSEISNLKSQINQLENINSELKEKIEARSLLQFTSVETQTNFSNVESLSDQNLPVNSFQTSQEIQNNFQLYFQQVQNKNAELENENFTLKRSLYEEGRRFYFMKKDLGQADEDCRRLDWHCHQQAAIIDSLKKENMWFRERSTGFEYLSNESSEFQNAYCQTQKQHPGSFYGDASFKKLANHLEPIREDEEQLSMQPTSTFVIPNIVSCNNKPEISSREEITIDGGQGDNTKTTGNLSDEFKTFSAKHANSRKYRKSNPSHKKKVNKSDTSGKLYNKRYNLSSQTTTSAASEKNVQLIDDLNSSSSQPIHVANPVYANRSGNNSINDLIFLFPDLDVNNFKDDGYSSSRNSITEETIPRNAELLEGDSAIDDGSYFDQPDNHYYVTYRGVRFDLINFSLFDFHNVAVKCGACTTTEGRDELLEFIAGKVDDLNNDSYWKNKHRMGDAKDWRSLKSGV